MPPGDESLQDHFTDGLSLQKKNENERWSLLESCTELIPSQTAELKWLPINNLRRERDHDSEWLNTHYIKTLTHANEFC